MPDLSELVQPKQKPGPSLPPIVRGTIAIAPTTIADPAIVTLPEYSGDHPWTCRWTPEGLARPAVGAACFVAFDNTGAAAIVWWDGSPTTFFPAPIVTSLPSGPSDGDEILYRFVPTTTPASTRPILWHLKFDEASDLWLPVGDLTPIIAERMVQETSGAIATNTWSNLAVNDPGVNVPLLGDYDAETECYASCSGIATVGVGIKVGATNPTIAANASEVTLNPAGNWGSFTNGRVITAVPASTFVVQYYWHNVGSNATISRGAARILIRPLAITPV